MQGLRALPGYSPTLLAAHEHLDQLEALRTLNLQGRNGIKPGHLPRTP